MDGLTPLLKRTAGGQSYLKWWFRLHVAGDIFVNHRITIMVTVMSGDHIQMNMSPLQYDVHDLWNANSQ